MADIFSIFSYDPANYQTGNYQPADYQPADYQPADHSYPTMEDVVQGESQVSPPPKTDPKTVDIVPDGNVVFVVGPNGDRLRVHSLVVMTASPVFSSMLGPNFREGRALAEAGSVEVELPEDDTEALTTVFNVLHGRNDKVKKELHPDDLLRVALASDKYACTTPLSFAVSSWLDPRRTTNAEHLWALAMGAAVFNRSELFAKTTNALLYHHAGSYMELAAKTHNELLDPMMQLRTASMLEEVRNKRRLAMICELFSAGNYVIEPPGKVAEPHFNSIRLLIHPIYKLASLSTGDSIQALGDVDEDQTMLPSELAFSHEQNTRMKAVMKRISNAFKKLHDQDGGICMGCAKTGEVHAVHRRVTRVLG